MQLLRHIIHRGQSFILQSIPAKVFCQYSIEFRNRLSESSFTVNELPVVKPLSILQNRAYMCQYNIPAVFILVIIILYFDLFVKVKDDLFLFR
jgi:hypothetical protein